MLPFAVIAVIVVENTFCCCATNGIHFEEADKICNEKKNSKIEEMTTYDAGGILNQ